MTTRVIRYDVMLVIETNLDFEDRIQTFQMYICDGWDNRELVEHDLMEYSGNGEHS